jgi:uncharacterized membrane protein YhfC
VVSSTICIGAVFFSRNRYELELKLAAFEEKLGFFFFVFWWGERRKFVKVLRLESYESDPLQCQLAEFT